MDASNINPTQTENAAVVVPDQPTITTNEAKSARSQQWLNAIDAELQDLIANANEINTRTQTAKTSTKKNYYKKKMAKLSDTIVRLLAAKQNIEALRENTDVGV